jgi:hypothetical protein
MESRLRIVQIALLTGFLVLACQFPRTSAFASGGIVSPGELIPLGQAKETGVWKGNDVTVDYRLTKGLNEIDLSGVARLNDSIVMNFNFLRDFHLIAVFTDSNGRILGSQALATNRGSLTPMGNAESTPFKARLIPPPGTADIAFGYDGTALQGDDGGGGTPTRFWQNVG